ncbi:MAG: hypothetical protein AMJ93_08550, partial [Anaerolineae bacterium SM23_84]
MKHSTRIKLLALAMVSGVTAVILMVGGLSTASATGAAVTGDVDLTVEMEAPAHVAVSSTFLVRIPFYNLGTSVPPDAWVTATLPAGTEFVTATDRWGDPLPPDTIDGNAFGWYFDYLLC